MRASAGESHRRAAGLFVATAIAVSSMWPGLSRPLVASAADASSDIPGVPLPGPVAAGRLGGAIYDVVFNFSVPPGYVIVASLSGTTGTDFDLYLFDSTATSVLSKTGLLTKSIGPTSTESISWPSRFGGTYYIDLNGASDIEGDYRLTVQMIPDPTPPVASLVIAGGREATSQLTVPVSVSASDDLSGVAEMAFSSDGIAYGEWQAYTPTANWTFPSGDGPKRLWVKVRNGVGLDSAPASATITVDTVPPSVVDIEPPPGSTVIGLRPLFTVTFNERIAAATWNDLGLIVQSPTGVLVLGTYTYDAAKRLGSFLPANDLQRGAPYIVTVGNVKDIADNRVDFSGSWSVTPIAPTSMVVKADPRVVTVGGSARLDVALDGAFFPATIDVLSRTSRSPGFAPIGSIPTEDGSGSLAVAPDLNTTYRFSYPGADGVEPAQFDVTVLVRRLVALADGSSAVTARANVGSPINLTAAVRPASAGISVSFRLYRFDAARRKWVYAGSHGRSTDATGRASYRWTPTAEGSWYWRVSVSSTPEYTNNMSPVYRWTIHR